MTEQTTETQKQDSAVVEEAQVTPVVPETEKATVEVKKEEKAVDTNLEELIAFLKNGDGYSAAITILSNGKLNHHLLTKNFPDLDLLKSASAVEKMIVERLKNL